MTPLHEAAMGDTTIATLGDDIVDTAFRQIAESLISHNANINSLSNYNGTPLYLAVLYRRKNMVNLLLKYGADFTLAVDNNVDPHSLAVQKKFMDILELFPVGLLTKRCKQK